MIPLDENVQSDQPAGSPGVGEPVFLVVGMLRKPHGVRGELVMDLHTDFPERLKAGLVVYVGDDHQPIKISTRRPFDQALLVSFTGIEDADQAGEMRNALVCVRADEIPALPEGEYYHHQILGLDVFDEQGRNLGVITDILETGANDVYVIRPASGPEILIPAIDATILEVNLAEHRMLVHLLPGLIPGE